MARQLSPSLAALLRDVKQHGRLTEERWSRQLRPLVEGQPMVATEATRALAELWTDSKISMDGEVREQMRRVLGDHGYGLPQVPPQPRERGTALRGLLSSNVSETDERFAWLLEKAGRAGAQVGVAVLDNGFDLFHPALGPKGWVNPHERWSNGVDDDRDGKVDNSHGWDYVDWDNDLTARGGDWHGTMTAGLAAKGTDAIRIHPARVIGGEGPYDVRKVAQAIDDVVAHGARVVNMSFGLGDADRVRVIRDAMLRHKDVLFVVAAGNDSRALGEADRDREIAANALPNLVVVASASLAGDKAGNSNFGPTVTHAAEGDKVTTSTPGAGYFGDGTGTSFAAPQLSNAAARVLLLDPALKPSQVSELLAVTSKHSEAWRDLVQAGGPIDVQKASTLAALTCLMRGGLSADRAAAKLSLDAASRGELIGLAARFV